MRRLADLKPWPKNSRKHSEEQIDLIVGLIEEYGWTTPIFIDEEDFILKGHGGHRAGLKMGIESAPTIRLDGLSKAQKRAYVIADNQVAARSSWDVGALKIELAGLNRLKFDLSKIGFPSVELRGLLDVGGHAEEDTPAPPAKPMVRRGDLWMCATKGGAHRIMCGDATSAEDVAQLLGAAKPHLMVTDAPYGVDYDPAWRQGKAPNHPKPGATGAVQGDDRSDWREAFALFPGDVIYAWCADLGTLSVAQSIVASGFELRAQIMWAKNHIVIGRGHYHFQHEPCWYAVRKGTAAHWSGGRKQSSRWDIDKPSRSDTGHSTQKPIECMRRPMENNATPGDGVYDPFIGSGTSLAAAEERGLICYGMDIDPAYIEVTLRRWAKITGREPVLEATRQTLADVTKGRGMDAAAKRARR